MPELTRSLPAPSSLSLDSHHGEPEPLFSDPGALEKGPLEKNPSRTSLASKNSRASALTAAHHVSAAERRGFFSSLVVLPEYYDAKQYLPRRKYCIVLIVAFAAVTGPMGTSILLPAVDELARDLDTNVATVNVSVGIYLLALGIFPLWWSNFSEKHGRRSVYVVSYVWFLAFAIGCALAPNISSLIVLRLFSGIGASAVQAVGAGTISDMYTQEQRGSALGVFYLGPLLGPFISPILGGAVSEAWGWRSTMWIIVIVCGINVVTILFFLPETLSRETVTMVHRQMAEEIEEYEEREEREERREGDDTRANGTDGTDITETADSELMTVNLHRSNASEKSAKSAKSNKSTRSQKSTRSISSIPRVYDDEIPVDPLFPTVSRYTTNNSSIKRPPEPERTHAKASVVYDYVVRPTHALVFLTYPPVLLMITYAAFVFMGIYFFNISISNRYSQPPYNFSPVILGLMYIPNSVTYIIASVYGGRWLDHLARKSAKRNDGDIVPECRLSWNVVVAVMLMAPACMIFGWCLDKGEHWVTPLIGTAIFGFASVIVIGCNVTYIIDMLPGKGATGVAINNLVRQVLSATATFVTSPLTDALGVGVLFSIYAGFITVLSLLLLFLKLKGTHLRHKYDIADYYAKQ